MNTVTKLTAIAAILASTSSWAMAQANVGAGAGANVGVDAGGASVGIGVWTGLSRRPSSGSTNGRRHWASCSAFVRSPLRADHRRSCGATRATFVGEPLDRVLHKTPAPLTNGMLMYADPRSDLLALKPLSTE